VLGRVKTCQKRVYKCLLYTPFTFPHLALPWPDAILPIPSYVQLFQLRGCCLISGVSRGGRQGWAGVDRGCRPMASGNSRW